VSESSFKAESFLTPAGREKVQAAIGRAEKRSSGEIRVHLDDIIADNPLDHAAYVFTELSMDRTQDRNGVLFYVSVVDRKLAVIGDSGINARVGEDYWTDVLEVVQTHFAAGDHAQGLIAGIDMTGEKLAEHFPHQFADTNELSDEISMG